MFQVGCSTWGFSLTAASKAPPEEVILPLEVSLTDTKPEITGCSLQSLRFQTIKQLPCAHPSTQPALTRPEERSPRLKIISLNPIQKAMGVILTHPTKTRAHAHKYLTPTAEPGWPQLCRNPNVAPADPGEAPLEPEVILFGFERALPGRRAQRGTVSLASIPDKSRQLRAEGG